MIVLGRKLAKINEPVLEPLEQPWGSNTVEVAQLENPFQHLFGHAQKQPSKNTFVRAGSASDFTSFLPRSSNREVRIRVPLVYFSRGSLPPKKGKRALLGDLVTAN